MSNFWPTNSKIIIREISNGKVWTVRPVTVIKHDSSNLVFYMSPQTTIKHPRKLDSDEVPEHLISKEWRLIDKEWVGGGALYISKTNEPFMLIGFRSDDNTKFIRWYVNLQDPLKITNLGFDYLDMELDIEIDENLSKWYWKDEEKFNKLVKLGIISESKAKHLKDFGKKVADDIISTKSLLKEWINWKPSSDIDIPTIPSGWDKIFI